MTSIFLDRALVDDSHGVVGIDRVTDPDLGLLERAADGDVESFRRLVERHQTRLHRLCHRLLGDAEAAREATQDVFLKVWRKAGGFRPQGKVSTWLYRVATNHCLNQLRRRRIVRFFSLADFAPNAPGSVAGEVELDPADDAPDAEERLMKRRRWRRLRGAIDDLSTGQRAVLVLVRFEGLSYRRAADVLGISVGAVESRLFRAMRTLEQRDAENAR